MPQNTAISSGIGITIPKAGAPVANEFAGQVGVGSTVIDTTTGTEYRCTDTDGATTATWVQTGGGATDSSVAALVTSGTNTKGALDARVHIALPAPTGVLATDWANISAAVTQASNIVSSGLGRPVIGFGAGVLGATEVTPYEIGPNSIPIVAGVAYRGIPPRQKQANTTPTQYLADASPTWVGGTVIHGDGTAGAFTANTAAPASVSSSTLDAQLGNVEIYGFGLDNFTYGIRVGSKNTMGLVWSKVDQVYARNCSVWGFDFVNFVHCDFGVLVSYGCQGAGRFHMEMDNLVYMGGNSEIRELYGILPQDSRDRRLCRGWVFSSTLGGGAYSSLGAMNEIEAGRIQFNSYNRPILTETVTLTNGSSSIAVADGTKYARGFLVNFATAVGGLTASICYVVQSVSGNNITIGTSKNAGTFTASASGTVSQSTYGHPLVEITTEDANSKMNSIFLHHVDVEGNGSAGVYIENSQNSFVRTSAAPNNVLHDIVVRTSTYTDVVTKANTSIDFDASSAGSCQHDGVRRVVVNRMPKGRYFDGTRALNALQVGTAQSGVTAPDFESAVQGFVRPNNGVGATIRTRDTDLTLSGAWVGTIIVNSSTARTFTLPTITDAAPSTSLVGMVFHIVNTGSASLTINTNGTQLFNKTAAKTSLSLTTGQQVTITAAKDGASTLFWLAGPIGTLA